MPVPVPSEETINYNKGIVELLKKLVLTSRVLKKGNTYTIVSSNEKDNTVVCTIVDNLDHFIPAGQRISVAWPYGQPVEISKYFAPVDDLMTLLKENAQEVTDKEKPLNISPNNLTEWLESHIEKR